MSNELIWFIAILIVVGIGFAGLSKSGLVAQPFLVIAGTVAAIGLLLWGLSIFVPYHGGPAGRAHNGCALAGPAAHTLLSRA
jgi:hypothetical protein